MKLKLIKNFVVLLIIVVFNINDSYSGGIKSKVKNHLSSNHFLNVNTIGNNSLFIGFEYGQFLDGLNGSILTEYYLSRYFSTTLKYEYEQFENQQYKFFMENHNLNLSLNIFSLPIKQRIYFGIGLVNKLSIQNYSYNNIDKNKNQVLYTIGGICEMKVNIYKKNFIKLSYEFNKYIENKPFEYYHLFKIGYLFYIFKK